MTDHFVMMLDNFYSSPQDIRQLALSLDFAPREGATYPGGEAYSDLRDWNAIRRRLFGFIDQNAMEQIPPGKDFRQGKFRLACAADNATRPDAVHQDQQRYSGVIYLSRNQDVHGGIGLFKCRRSGELAMTPRWFQSIAKWSGAKPGDAGFAEYSRAYLSNWDNWELIGELPMRFNRAIVLMARCFHASTGIFGTDKESSRLTQHFELYI